MPDVSPAETKSCVRRGSHKKGALNGALMANLHVCVNTIATKDLRKVSSLPERLQAVVLQPKADKLSSGRPTFRGQVIPEQIQD